MLAEAETPGFRLLPTALRSEYRIVATLSGFRNEEQQGIRVFLGQEGTVNMTMAPAGVTEEVRVTASSPLADVRGGLVSQP